jgi:hypothetical protein
LNGIAWAFFDVMTHSTVHVVQELDTYGQVHSRWMYPIERANENIQTLVENPPFLTKSFQLHDICNYVSIGFFNFKIKLWKLPIKLICLLIGI